MYIYSARCVVCCGFVFFARLVSLENWVLDFITVRWSRARMGFFTSPVHITHVSRVIRATLKPLSTMILPWCTGGLWGPIFEPPCRIAVPCGCTPEYCRNFRRRAGQSQPVGLRLLQSEVVCTAVVWPRICAIIVFFSRWCVRGVYYICDFFSSSNARVFVLIVSLWYLGVCEMSLK